MLSLYVDPNTGGGMFRLDRSSLSTILCHLAYSTLTYLALRGGVGTNLIRKIATPLDLLFATAIAYFTEGRTSPAFVFFVFAIIAVGFRSGFRDTIMTTLWSVILYGSVVELTDGFLNLYLMRAVYLAIAGYMIGFFGQQRLDFEARLRTLEAEAERETIARSLHDGYIQALAGISLRLESCRDMLVNHQPEQTLAEIKEIQAGVNHEYDEVREYVRSLTGADTRGGPHSFSNPEFHVQASFVAEGMMIEHIMQIVLEAVRNTRRHGRAKSASISVQRAGAFVNITIDDDGVGFEDLDNPPWTIASRVAESGGRLAIKDAGRGAHLEITVPAE